MINTLIYPCTDLTISAFHKRVKAPNDDIPTIELNDVNVRNLEVIWTTINDLSPKWIERKKCGLRIPSEPIERKAFWGTFAEKWTGDDMPILNDFILQTNGKGKIAIDLGCGRGVVTQALLKQGWNVIAVDNSPKVLELLSKMNKSALESGQLKVFTCNITKFKPDETADLVICKNTLPYINPGKFQTLWKKIPKDFLKEKGILIGTLFTTASHPEQLVEMNKIKEVGGWFIPDRRMVRPLLENAGYKVEKCIFHKNIPKLEPKDQINIHFIAVKNQ